MKKSELLRALQTEIQRHSLSTFMNAEHKIVETGCPACQKHFGTVDQVTRHITEDRISLLHPWPRQLVRRSLSLPSVIPHGRTTRHQRVWLETYRYLYSACFRSAQ